MAKLRVALGQINSVVGDIHANTKRILTALAAAEEAGCHAAVFPELAVTGYPPEDLLLKRRFVQDSRKAMEEIAARSGSCTAVVGFVDGADRCWNAAGIAADGQLLGVYHKRELPNYGVFDERRYFQPGTGDQVLHEVAGVALGVSVCEDAWVSGGPMSQMAAAGAEVIFNLNASPYHVGKLDQRLGVLRQRVSETGCAIVYANLVGGQDELVFDGASLVLDTDGRVIAQAPAFQEHLLIAEVEVADRPELPPPPSIPQEINRVDPGMDEVDEQYEALVLATRDYVHKNGFTDVGIGLSGGIDSSLVAVIAADALGADHVHGVLMPSRYSSDHSLADAEALCQNLGINHRIIPVEAGHQAFLDMLAPSFEGMSPDLAEENVQSRIRGTLLMALSNKFGWLILTTGNKSESAVGYSTLYGDTAGAYAVIKDLWKLQVYAFASHRNQRAGCDLIPENVLVKPPSAELRPDQRDDQSLPPYDVLDPLLEAYVEGDLTPADLCGQGYDPELVSRITGLVDRAEYKRRQNPPGVRITAKAFGRDRRLPITNRYRGGD
ncbi:MAG: NAD+ synthase [Acidimicrobiia bacterium]|nr:NAD+ synthase [Acidimicrobiia bacterium]MYG71883.1 NAD+ synthase [Acidimicrobiia bacterium]MYH96206.1 NAD+ synthase [Acidimicrobiia bacterium]MYL10492.1 NAD+ synthase [Acidimicrobiia bacterium]